MFAWQIRAVPDLASPVILLSLASMLLVNLVAALPGRAAACTRQHSPARV